MALRTLIKNGKLVLPDGVMAADVHVEGEKIAAITEPGFSGDAEQQIDASGQYVFSGLIDPHVHLGYGRYPEDFDSETAAAAVGGVTTMLSYNWVLGDYAEWFAKSKALGEERAHIDFGFHFGLMGSEHISNLAELERQYGVSSYKFYMQYMNNPGRKKGIELNYADMYEAFRQVAAAEGRVLCVHCEDPDLIERISSEKRDREEPEAWLESRPGFTEARGVQASIDFALLTGATCYLVHMSSKESLDLIRRYRSRGEGPPIFVETCPHYMSLTYKDIKGSLGKVNPPIRTSSDNEALWQAVADGIIDTVGSDHIARSLADKEGGLWQAKAGFGGSYAILPILFTEGHLKRGIPLERIAQITSYNTARIFGLYPKKGKIMPGADADLVIVDPNIEKTFRAGALPSGSEFSVYEGIKAKGWPSVVMSRGRTIVSDGDLQKAAGHGRYQARSHK